MDWLIMRLVLPPYQMGPPHEIRRWPWRDLFETHLALDAREAIEAWHRDHPPTPD